MFIDPPHKTALAVDPIASVVASLRTLIGLPADDSSSGVMVAAVERTGLDFLAIEQTGNRHGDDIILGRLHFGGRPAALPVFAIGVRLHWKYLWHPRFYLWLPRTGEPAVFVPALHRAYPCFRIDDSRLFADQCMPFASMADRERGIRAAHAALCSLVEG